MKKALSLLAIAVSAFVSPAFADEPEPMAEFTLNGYELAGAEYWPFIADVPFNYPDDVLWGFYAEGTTQVARDCARVAYDKLKVFLTQNTAELQRVVALGATKRFYLWTDDYSQASANRSRRANSMWHWNRGDHDYSQGYWKWESVVTQDGRCLIPQAAQIRTALRQAITELERPRPTN